MPDADSMPTDHTRSVESVLQVRDLLLVLVSVRLERLETSTQQTDLRLVVGQLLVIAMTTLPLLQHCLVRLLQSAQSRPHHHLSFIPTTSKNEMSDARYRKVCLRFVDYSPEDTLDYSQGVESFDQFSQIA